MKYLKTYESLEVPVLNFDELKEDIEDCFLPISDLFSSAQHEINHVCIRKGRSSPLYKGKLKEGDIVVNITLPFNRSNIVTPVPNDYYLPTVVYDSFPEEVVSSFKFCSKLLNLKVKSVIVEYVGYKTGSRKRVFTEDGGLFPGYICGWDPNKPNEVINISYLSKFIKSYGNRVRSVLINFNI